MRRNAYTIGALLILALAAAALTACGGEEEEAEGRLKEVRDSDRVVCASRNDVPGFGHLDAGNNVGFDIDLCRAGGGGRPGDPNKIEIRLINAAERGPTIQSGEVDILVRTVTWDDVAGCSVGQLRSDDVLRRPGIHGEQGAEPGRDQRAGLGWDDRLRHAGHDDGAEPPGLLHAEQPGHPGAGLRGHRRGGGGL